MALLILAEALFPFFLFFLFFFTCSAFSSGGTVAFCYPTAALLCTATLSSSFSFCLLYHYII